MFYVIASSVCLLVGLIIIAWMHNQYQLDIVVKPVRSPENAPLISICIPARNEERNIERCVEALLAQTYPNFEIIILDDRSIDATHEILVSIWRRWLSSFAKTYRNPPPTRPTDKLRIIDGSDLPPGPA